MALGWAVIEEKLYLSYSIDYNVKQIFFFRIGPSVIHLPPPLVLCTIIFIKMFFFLRTSYEWYRNKFLRLCSKTQKK
jgi:hypothetical protein